MVSNLKWREAVRGDLLWVGIMRRIWLLWWSSRMLRASYEPAMRASHEPLIRMMIRIPICRRGLMVSNLV
jgi:hypothetical protein